MRTNKAVINYLSNADSENAADDFAGNVGYGKHIASGLRKLAEIMPQKFDNEKVKARMKQMASPT